MGEAAVVPFLTPAIILLVILAVAVMAYYVLYVVRPGGTSGKRDAIESPSIEARHVGDVTRTAQPQDGSMSYDMENNPAETWGQSAG